MILNERVVMKASPHKNMIIGITTGRVVATFFNETEAKSFVDVVNGIKICDLRMGERVIAFHEDWGFDISTVDENGKIPIGVNDYAEMYFELPNPDLLYN